MRTRPLPVAALVVVSVASAHARPPVLPLPARPAAPPPVATFDQLIDRLAGFTPDTEPAPVAWYGALDVLTGGEPFSMSYLNRPGMIWPSELSDRFDALGGLPLAHTRWSPDSARKLFPGSVFPSPTRRYERFDAN